MSTVLSHERLKTYLVCYGSENGFWLCKADDRDHSVEQFESAGIDGEINDVFECVPPTNRYLVRQRRAMWVCFVQKVEAEDDDAAVNVFQDRFNPQHSFIEGAVQRLERGPIAVFDRRDFPRVRDVVDAD